VGLSYCNHCGARLNGSRADHPIKVPHASLDSLVWAIVSVAVGGLGVIIGLLAVMKQVLDFSPGLIIAFTLISFLLLFAPETALIWLLVRQKSGPKELGEAARQKGHETKELGATQERMLPEPGISVTEGATRTFEPVFSQRKAE
jgi:hypothetical protein